MSKKSDQSASLSFFAAANGYSGFRSYFNSIFDPRGYESLYILKGGPGTGKSSFMKRLSVDVGPMADECEAIYCSSDPSSLDGVIIKSGERQVAVIDGTAPHSSDPAFPGAVDKIINLGENWDEELLIKERDRIISLAESKGRSYKKAYKYLSVAGKITEIVDGEVRKLYQKNDGAALSSLLSDLAPQEGRVDVRLVSAYGKDGFVSLDTLSHIASKQYSVVGVYGSEYVFMSRLIVRLNQLRVNYTLFPDALDGDKAYAVLIPSAGLAVTTARSCGIDDEHAIDTSRFLDQRGLKDERSHLEFLWQERESLLWSAADQFKKASYEHFELEKIYSTAMDFSKNEELYRRCVTDIKKKLAL